MRALLEIANRLYEAAARPESWGDALLAKAGLVGPSAGEAVAVAERGAPAAYRLVAFGEPAGLIR